MSTWTPPPEPHTAVRCTEETRPQLELWLKLGLKIECWSPEIYKDWFAVTKIHNYRWFRLAPHATD